MNKSNAGNTVTNTERTNGEKIYATVERKTLPKQNVLHDP